MANFTLKITIVLMILPLIGIGQSLSNFSIGIHTGLTQSGTDTHTWGNGSEGIFDESHILTGGTLEYQLSNSIVANLSYVKTKISGDDLNIEALKFRGWKFASPLNEISLNIGWHFLAYKRNNHKRIYSADGKVVNFHLADLHNKIYYSHSGLLLSPFSFLRKVDRSSPYFILGISSSFINPEINFRNTAPEEALLQSDLSKQKSNYFHLGIGLGMAYQISDRLSFNAEIRGVIPQTDLLDGMASVILEYNSDRNKDSYQYALLRLNYSLQKNNNCDSDDLEDKYDKCPCENGPTELWGCPDRDADGIVDKYDECPDTMGLPALNGCPDTDKDNIPDHLDLCPSTFGLLLFDGCPDRDADGIPDKDDKCPDTPGSKRNEGCPI